MVNLPVVGEVAESALVLTGVAVVIGYVVGGQIKSALKYALIIVVIVFLAGFVTPVMLGQLVEAITALKPLYENLLGGAGGTQNVGGATLGFLAGFFVGLVKG